MGTTEVTTIALCTLCRRAKNVEIFFIEKKVKVSNDKEMAQSEENSQSKNRGGKKTDILFG